MIIMTCHVNQTWRYIGLVYDVDVQMSEHQKKKAPLYGNRFIIGIIEHMDLFPIVLVSRPTFLIKSLSAR